MDDQRLLDDRADAHARIERRVRILEDDLHVAAGAAAAPRARTPARRDRRTAISPEVGSISRRMQRPVVVLPLPDSPTRPNVSPRSIVKLTSLTARTVGRPCRRGRCGWRSPSRGAARRAAASGALLVAHLWIDRAAVQIAAGRVSGAPMPIRIARQCGIDPRPGDRVADLVPGGATSHGSNRFGQRGANAQPGGSWPSGGTVP